MYIIKKDINYIKYVIVISLLLLSITLYSGSPLPRHITIGFDFGFTEEDALNLAEKYSEYGLKLYFFEVHPTQGPGAWYVFNLKKIHPLLMLDKIIEEQVVLNFFMLTGWVFGEKYIRLHDDINLNSFLESYTQFDLELIRSDVFHDDIYRFNTDLVCDIDFFNILSNDERVRNVRFRGFPGNVGLPPEVLIIRFHDWVVGDIYERFLIETGLTELECLNPFTNTKKNKMSTFVNLHNNRHIVYFFYNYFPNFNFIVDTSIYKEKFLLQTKTSHFVFPNPVINNDVVSFQVISDLFHDRKSAESSILKIFNIKGQLVYNSSDFQIKYYEIIFSWDGRDTNQRNVPSGIYLYHINTQQQNLSGKFLIINK